MKTLILALSFYFVAFVGNSQKEITAANSMEYPIEKVLQTICDIDSELEFYKQNLDLINVNYPNRSFFDSISLTAFEYNYNIGLLKVKNEWLKNVVSYRKDELCGSFSLSFRGIKYEVVITDNFKTNISFHHKNKKGKRYLSLGNVKKDLENEGRNILMLTNGGMYTPESDPEGLYIENYKELYPIDTGSSEVFLNFYMHPNGVYYIDKYDHAHITTTPQYVELSKDSTFVVKYATQSGPMLRIDGKMHHKFNKGSKSKKLRSGVGIYNDLSVFAITRGVSNFYDFSSFFDEVFHCENALFLDGVISRMYEPKLSSNDLGGVFGVIISITQ